MRASPGWRSGTSTGSRLQVAGCRLWNMARVGDDTAFRYANHRKDFAKNREHAMQRHRSITLLLVALLAMVGAVLPMSPAAARPTSEFNFGPAEPSANEPVTFNFTGSCDVEPCGITWTWFVPGGSSRGTSMGKGDGCQPLASPGGCSVTYAFP